MLEPGIARRNVAHALDKLEKLFGIPQWKRKKPLDELVVTILSQNTNDSNRDKAYNRLRERFPDWHKVMNADVEDIEEAIRPAGLARQKASRLKAILGWIDTTFGKLDLSPLAEMENKDVFTLLTTQKGIGVKTVAVLLAFVFDRDLCPVDTHVHRISKRLGWAPVSASAVETFRLLKDLIPAGKAATFHLNLLKFGRNICTARNPQCTNCPLWDYCIWEKKRVG